MMEKTSNHPARGCLVVALSIMLSCGIWFFLIEPKGILLGLALYCVMRFADFFHDVFAPRREE